MARTIKEIQEAIIENMRASENEDIRAMAVPETYSKSALWRLWTYIVAGAMHVLELLFDTHRGEMEKLLLRQHAHTFTWYETLAKSFMYGDNIQPEPFSSGYDTTGMTDAEIEKKRIVRYASCTLGERLNGRLYLKLKVAKDGEDQLEKLNNEELTALRSYVYASRDAGVDIFCDSVDPDRIKMNWTVYYDPKILDKHGRRIGDLTDADKNETDPDKLMEKSVVRKAIKQYLKQLSFNGRYVPTHHIDAIQQVEGVAIPVIDGAPTMSSDNGSTWQDIPAKGVVPSSGWCKFHDEGDLVVQMLPFENEIRPDSND